VACYLPPELIPGISWVVRILIGILEAWVDPEISELPGMAEGDKMVTITALYPDSGPEGQNRARAEFTYRAGKLISGGRVLWDNGLFGVTD
jgi:hypothetical protein